MSTSTRSNAADCALPHPDAGLRGQRRIPSFQRHPFFRGVRAAITSTRSSPPRESESERWAILLAAFVLEHRMPRATAAVRCFRELRNRRVEFLREPLAKKRVELLRSTSQAAARDHLQLSPYVAGSHISALRLAS